MDAKTSCQMAAIASLLWSVPYHSALADMVAATERPSFSAAEQLVIARNASLVQAVRNDPWAVRQFMDRLNETPSNQSPADGQPAADPDIQRFERASPEASLDLLQIIKQAGNGGSTGLAR